MIDIIIPIHGTSGNLERTLCSIAFQDKSDKLNVIIVNDFSVDYSNLIKFFSNYIFINEIKLDKFSGLNYSRKIGFEASSNDYVVFMESGDSFICRDVLNKFYNEIKKESYDYVSGSVIENYENNFYLCNNCRDVKGKIFKRSFLENNDIDFCDIFYEDTCFFIPMLSLYGAKDSFLPLNFVLSDKNISYFNLDDVFKYDFSRLSDYINNLSLFINNNLDDKNIDFCLEIIFSFLVHMYFWYLKNCSDSNSNNVIKNLNGLLNIVSNCQIDYNFKTNFIREVYDIYYKDLNKFIDDENLSFDSFLSLICSLEV